MIKDEQRNYLLKANEKLIIFLNQIIGSGKDKTMSQRELAKHLGCSNSTVARWLRRECPLSIDIAIKICDILNLDKNEFLGDILLVDDSDLKERFMCLTEENKARVIEYIDFLLYQDKNSKKSSVNELKSLHIRL